MVRNPTVKAAKGREGDRTGLHTEHRAGTVAFTGRPGEGQETKILVLTETWSLHILR